MIRGTCTSVIVKILVDGSFIMERWRLAGLVQNGMDGFTKLGINHHPKKES
jgi:hypothetical protein